MGVYRGGDIGCLHVCVIVYVQGNAIVTSIVCFSVILCVSMDGYVISCYFV